eukprot:SAG25_NODE_10638_length_327_cov_0.649123_1_plen_64_part_10
MTTADEGRSVCDGTVLPNDAAAWVWRFATTISLACAAGKQPALARGASSVQKLAARLMPAEPPK